MPYIPHECLEMEGEVSELFSDNAENPIYAETEHGTYWFGIKSVEKRTVDGETITVLKLQELRRN